MIKPKHKKCKGTGKAAGYGCGEESLHRRYGLCLSNCYGDWLYNTPEGKEKLLGTIKTVQAPRKSLEKAIEFDKETKGIQAALELTKGVVHGMVNLRDRYKPCISCGCQWNDNFEAGHYFAVNNYRSLRFNFHNINGQCFYCNNKLYGNFDNYTLRLPDRIGKENFDKLIELAKLDKKQNTHWLKSDLTEIRKEARLIIKQLKHNI